jgi:uncharacterized protein
MPFEITDLAALEALYEPAAGASLRKEVQYLTPEYRRILEASPFCAVATSGPGGLDCSPRGDGPGFVHVLTDRMLAMPDRRGNNRLDTLRNIVADPKIALLFLIPGVNETLRVNGRAALSVDPALTERFAVDGKAPKVVITVAVDTVYFQCARALIRSGLWNPALHATRASLPTAGQMTKAADAAFDAETYDAALPARQAATLY